MTTRIERLLDESEFYATAYARLEYRIEVSGESTSALLDEIEQLKAKERRVNDAIALLENCEHPNREGIYCPDCGIELRGVESQ